MKLAIIGYGQAGGKVLDTFIEYDRATRSKIVASGLAINSARGDLLGLRNVADEHKLLIGQERVKGHGVGADNELGAEIAKEDMDEIQGAVDDIPVHDLDAFLIVTALGGGTGSGGAPVLARRLKRLYTEPVYGLGILPSKDEGGIYTLNAARSFKTMVDEVDNLMVFDNDAWRKTGESMEAGYDDINEEIVKRFGILFGAGETRRPEDVGESVVDASEIINTLAGGGISTVGYATTKIEDDRDGRGLLGRFRRREQGMMDSTNEVNRITSLVRAAALGRLTLPCNIYGAERCLLVVAGPPDNLNRKGIERGRKWIEEETGSMVVRGGDYPVPNSQYLAAVILLSGVTDIPRVEELQEVAMETIDNIVERGEMSKTKLRSLLDEKGEIEPLF